MVEPRLLADLLRGSLVVGQRLILDRSGLVLVGGKIVMCLVRLYGSPTVVVWSKEICNSRAKTAKGAVDYFGNLTGVYCSRKIAVGSVGIFGSRAKVMVGCVMLVRSRKIAYRYVMISFGCSVDHYGLFPFIETKLSQTIMTGTIKYAIIFLVKNYFP
ncbi:Hypothetical protein LUCI_1445 [Lucifera butyrica]|uniref:Uncharacterized protein n=1 Tax=Lucifera butyrica TaxID=1351585 RepID=A0A498R511_9FIRM|nr:Hypothetical protein LUCI_1445 [Lucifera butyrica]